MDDRIYRHSVWIDVFGVLLAGAVLLGGAAYLLYHIDGMGRILVVEANRRGEVPTAARRAQGSRAQAQSRPGLDGASAFSSDAGPLLGDRSIPTGPTGTATPFSDRWQDEAAPDLSSPSTAGASLPSGGAPANPGRSASSGPAIALSQSPGGFEHLGKRSGNKSAQTGKQDGRSSWRGEARELAGRARALSSQLRQLEQESSAGESTRSTARKSPRKASAASAGTNDRDVPNPPNVPIDDHLHWLLVAGVLWGTWRIWRGAG